MELSRTATLSHVGQNGCCGRIRWTGFVSRVLEGLRWVALGDITVEPVEAVVNAESRGH